MPDPTTTPPVKDEFFESIKGLAKRYKLEGEAAETFIHEHMTHAGYTVERSYVAPAPDGGKDPKTGGNGSGWFK